MNNDPTSIQELKALRTRVSTGEVIGARANVSLRLVEQILRADKLVLQYDKLRACEPLSPEVRADFKKRTHLLREGPAIKQEIRRLLRAEALRPRVEAIEDQVTGVSATLA